MWYFDLSCGHFSSMILHCDDGIRHVEAVLEEPTNHIQELERQNVPRGSVILVSLQTHWTFSNSLAHPV